MNEAEYLAAVDTLLAEPVGAAHQRAFARWSALVADPARPVVLFGAGGIGRRVAAHLRAGGRVPVCFVDNNPARWGARWDDIPILGPDDAATRYGADGVWLVSIFGAGQGHRYSDTARSLRARGVREVVSFAEYAWVHAEAFLPAYPLGLPDIPLRAPEAVRAAARLFEEAASRAEYLGQLRWRITGDYDALPAPASAASEYFDDTLVDWRGGWFVDAGAFDGDTVARFARWTRGAFDGVIAVEADPRNLGALQRRLAELGLQERVRVAPVALAGRSGAVRFAASGDAGASVSATGDQEVPARTLAEVVGAVRPALVKLDIEGSEVEVLTNARAAIGAWGCDVIACAYHRPEHLWEVPLRLAEAVGGPLLLRGYGSEGYDLVAYARGAINRARTPR